MNKSNFSSAEDMALLVAECMRFEPFRKVVGTIDFETKAQNCQERKKPTVYKWKNSNKLLGELDGIKGCKTGITNAAGPCFAGYYEKDGLKLALVLCHSNSLEDRWVEIKQMVDFVICKTNKAAADKHKRMA